MKTTLALIFILVSLTTFGQELNRKITDEKSGKEILIGVCNKEGLLQAPFSDWFQREYETYKPDEKTIWSLKPYAGKWKAVIVMGTWCSDSKTQLPRFFKVIESAGCSPLSLKMLCLDSENKCGNVDLSGLKIEKIPTFIIYKGNKEIGRITETPSINMETDLLNIFKK